MATKARVRQIVQIDEEKCNGCGLCVPNCAEGAIQIIDGKARLVADNLCDGLGACLGHCPEDAITVIERAAEDFDEKAVEKHLGHKGGHHEHHHHEENMSKTAREHMHAHMSGGCPGARVMNLQEERKASEGAARQRTPSALAHWPVKLILIPPHAPFLRGKELLLTADCVGVAHPELHNELLAGKAIAIACPKFDDAEFYIERLTDIVRESGITGIKVVHMEVPCCGGLNHIASEAVKNAGSDIPVERVVIGIRGDQLT